MSARTGKRYQAALEKVDRERFYSPNEAIRIVREFPEAKFDETVEVAVRLGVDPRKADQMVRGTVSLPHGTGKSVRVAAFASGDKAREAREAGADVVGAEDLAAKVQEGGHGHQRHREGRRGDQGGEARVPRRPAGEPRAAHRQALVRREGAAGELRRGDPRDPSREAGGRKGAVPEVGDPVHHHGAGHPHRSRARQGVGRRGVGSRLIRGSPGFPK